MRLKLTPENLQQIREGLRYMAKEVVEEHVGKLRYSHQRGATCTCGAQVARYDRESEFNGGTGLPLTAAAIAQLVKALRPIVLEMIHEAVPTPGPPQSHVGKTKPIEATLPPEEVRADYALKAMDAGKSVNKSIPLADTFPQIPRDVAAMYSKQATEAVCRKREAGDKNATYVEEHRRLCYQHMSGDRSSEFQRVRYAAEADVASRQHAAVTANLESRVKYLEATGPSGDRRKKLADEAAEKVYYARQRGEKLDYRDVLQRLHSEAGLRT